MLALLRVTVAAAVAIPTLMAGGAAVAGLGQPSPWQTGLQQSASPVMDNLVSFHNFLLVLITLITAFVLALLVVVIVKFNARANPTPSRTTHNTLIEVLWTVIPVVILVVIAIPSFRLLFFQLNIPPADLTVKATGKQWYWSYSYPDHGKFEFDSLMLQDADRKKMQPEPPRLLAVDNDMVVPVNKVVRVQTIGADVIHAFAMPSFGIKIDAIPGRLNETWFRADPRRASTTASARSCAARTTPSCRSRCGWSASRPSPPGSRTRRRNMRATNAKARAQSPPPRSTAMPRRTTIRVEESWQRRSLTACTTHTGRTRRTPIRPAGGASSIRPTTRTSARCTSSSR